MVEMHFEIVNFAIWATKRKLPIMLNSAFAQKSGLGLASVYFTEQKADECGVSYLQNHNLCGFSLCIEGSL